MREEFRKRTITHLANSQTTDIGRQNLKKPASPLADEGIARQPHSVAAPSTHKLRKILLKLYKIKAIKFFFIKAKCNGPKNS